MVIFDLYFQSNSTVKKSIKKPSAKPSINNGDSYYYSNTGADRPQAPHHKECLELLPNLKGWERIFVSHLLTQSGLNIFQREKLNLIKKNHKETRRCRHCMDRVSFENEDFYFCEKCGQCLNLGFASREITGGAIDA